MESQASEWQTVTAGQEAWIITRIEKAMKMAIRLYELRKTGADTVAFNYGVMGIAEGTALEIIDLLGLQPAYENIRKIDEIL